MLIVSQIVILNYHMNPGNGTVVEHTITFRSAPIAPFQNSLREHMIKKMPKKKDTSIHLPCCFVIACFLAGDMTFGQIASAQHSDFNSFRGIEWGQHISTIHQEEFQLHLQDGIMEYYTRKGDNLQVGPVSVETIQYGFWRDRFMEVRISVLASPKDGLNALASVLGEDYEEEAKNTKWFYCQHSYIWEKPKTRTVLVGPPTRIDKEPATCMVTITSKRILAEKKVYDYSGHVVQ
jgi:hypothetical protein